MSNSIEREALVASVTCVTPPVSRQIKKLSTVPNASSPRLRPRASTGRRVKDRRYFGAREIRIEQEACLSADERFVSRRLQSITGVGSPAILPDDRAMHRPPARALPHQRGLALICNADPGEVTRRYSGSGKRKATCLENGPPEIFGIVLHPAGAGEVLRKFLLPDASDVELGIEHDRSRRGRALVNGENVGAHVVWSLLPRLSAVAYFHANRRLAGSLFWLMVTADAQERHARSSSYRGGQDLSPEALCRGGGPRRSYPGDGAASCGGATTQGAVGPAARGY